MNEVRLPPFEYDELKGARLLEAKSNWAFKHWRIEEIWKHTRGENIRVAVLDTGEPEHKDIDVFRSIDFTGEGPKDKQGHGTWVSGCVAAKRGFLGLAPGCRLYTAKVLDNQGEGAWLWMKKGLEWAMEEGCEIVNISAGGDYSGSEIQPILKKMSELGIVIVCAAGNADAPLIFPANNENTIAIGSVNEEWGRSIFSNWGPRLIGMAPGEYLLGCWLENGYVKASGTSMSAPGVAGILALEAELRSIDYKGVIAKLATTSEDMEEIGWDAMTGWGIIDPFKFLGLEEPKKKSWKWVWSVLIFLVMYFMFGAPTAVIAKILKKENGGGDIDGNG